MKKLFIILMIAIFCVSCATEVSTVNNTDGMIESIVHFEYNGHKYIRFESFGFASGVVHDPDCQCNKK